MNDNVFDIATSRRGMLAGTLALPCAIGGFSSYLQAQEVDVSMGAGPNPLNIFDVDAKYAPVSPLLAKKTFVWDGNKETEVPWASLTEEARRAQLSNQDAKVTVEKVINGGSIGYLDSGLSAEKGKYRVTVDYLRFKDEIVKSGTSVVGRGKVGVGVRVTARVITKKRGLNLSGLLPIAFNFQRSLLSGELEINAIGIVSSEIAKIISTPTSLSEESITKAMESFGAFRVVVDAAETRTVPHLLSVARTSTSAVAVEDSVKSLGLIIS